MLFGDECDVHVMYTKTRFSAGIEITDSSTKNPYQCTSRLQTNAVLVTHSQSCWRRIYRETIYRFNPVNCRQVWICTTSSSSADLSVIRKQEIWQSVLLRFRSADESARKNIVVFMIIEISNQLYYQFWFQHTNYCLALQPC